MNELEPRFSKQDALYPDYRLAEELEAFGPFNTEACFQCRKCTNGCPVTFAMDLYPDQVIRLVLIGQREAVLSCHTIWVCSACKTCTTRCPNEVKITELMDCLKEMAIQDGVPCPQPQILTLHEIFLDNVKKRGRLFEVSFLPSYLLRSGEFTRKWRQGRWQADAKLGLQMIRKGKFSPFPKRIRGAQDVRRILSPSRREKNSS